MRFDRLYKKASDGKLQIWDIWTEDNVIHTSYGDEGGAQQTTSDTIKAGKNIGRANETSAAQQAEAEARSKWEKKQKKGYVKERERALAGENDRVGGWFPMLAAKFGEQGHKINYPAQGQFKLDGGRCCAEIENGVATLWTRTREPILSMPHVIEALEEMFQEGSWKIDGELYNHEFRVKYGDRAFDIIMSLMRQSEPQPECRILQFHAFDQNMPKPFSERHADLALAFESQANNPGIPTIDVDVRFTWDPKKKPLEVVHQVKNQPVLILVETRDLANEDEVLEFFDVAVAQKYEGIMVRNAAGAYLEHATKRSTDLQKLKEFMDGEFEVVDIEEGRGKLQGAVGAFVCVHEGRKFRVKPKGEGITARLRDYFTNHTLWKGKRLQIRYQGLTGKNAVPRCPVGIRFRDEVL